MNWFARIVAHHPYVVLIAVAVFAGTCIVIPLTTRKLPNFSDPQLGFEARGTVIGQRLTAWKNLLEATRPSGPLTVNPKDLPIYSNEIPQNSISYGASKDVGTKGAAVAHKITHWENQLPRASWPHGVSTVRPNSITKLPKTVATWVFSLNSSDIIQGELRNQSETETFQQDEWKSLNDLDLEGFGDEHFNHDDHEHLAKDGFFCDSPSPNYSRVVFGSTDGSDLFTLESIHSMCHLEALLMEGPQFHDLCQTISHDTCCHTWSLGNYVALLHNRTSCFDVTREDVNATRELLKMCAHYFHNLQLNPDCSENEHHFCPQVPTQCSQHNAVYNMMYYLLDINFLPPNDSRNNSLLHLMLFLPIAESSATLQYYHTLDPRLLHHGTVEVTAMQFGLKNTLFDECLVRDTWMIGAGGTFVLLNMWLYTGSLFVTLMTIIAIIFSLGISYFLYTLVFELRFFPFMNLLASIVAVGIGADDAFIFCKVWQCAKAEKSSNGTLVKLVNDTLRHATLSMFVTSLTTAAAFYASYISSITAIGCFSVFAGTATLVNFALMVTWLPASVVLSERWCCPPVVQCLAWDNKLRPARAVAEQVWTMLDRVLLLSVTRLRYLWLFLLGGAAIASLVVIFYHPRLKLPDSKDFQLFNSNHPFERYDLVYKEMFWFERLQKGESDSNLNMKLPMRFVWGILPLDNGDYLDPASRGTLVFDPTFDIAAPKSQKWLLKFCQRLRSQPFYEHVRGPLLPNCFIESFTSWMQRRCIDPFDKLNRTPCCETEKPPYSRKVFEQCIVKAIADLYETPAEYFMPGVAGPKFSNESYPPKIRALVVEYDSNHSYSMSFSDMDNFYKQVEMWMHKQMLKAPLGMRNGWFVSELEFYDLQNTLSRDTLVAIGVSMGIALVVLLAVTLNILISVYTILTITCIIFVTVATLVLFGWRLNVLESIAVSVAVGLAVDFSLHYGVHYRMCPDDRETATAYTLSRMGGPTAMAALTTLAVGAFMLPSSVLAYIQIGIFLVVVMVVSWVYSTFFLGALLRVGGPQHGFGQFAYPTPDRCCGGDTVGGPGMGIDHLDKTVYTNVLSESTLSTSSTVCPLHMSESHELEALTSKRHGNSFSKRLKRSSSLSTTQASTSNSKVTRKVSLPPDQSPSATSATTIVLLDDADPETRPPTGDDTDVPLVRH